MKLIEKDTNRVIEINMYIMNDEGTSKSNDVAPDMFEGCAVVTNDADYCIDQVIDWVHAWGDFDYGDPNEKRLAIVNGLLYTNYEM